MPKKNDENRLSIIGLIFAIIKLTFEDQRLLINKKEIEFDPKYKPPLLQLPRDANDGNTKRKNDFDWSSVRKKPFSFEIQREACKSSILSCL